MTLSTMSFRPARPSSASGSLRLARFAFATAMALLVVAAGHAERQLQRPTKIFSTKTRFPRVAGVPPLVAPGANTPVVYYSKLSFEGERHLAQGPYIPHHSGGSPSQARSVIAGTIVYQYNPTTDSIDVSNSVLVSGGTVTVPPWDATSGPFPSEPVLSAEVPVNPQGGVQAGTNNPFSLAVRDATHAGDNNVFEYYSNEPQVIFFQPGPAIERRDNFQMALSDPDTPEQAEGRAKVYLNGNELNPEFQSSMRGTFANGNPWTIREVTVDFTFPCSCSGLYEMVRTLHRRQIGSPAWSFYKEERETRPVDHGDWNGTYAIPQESGYEIRLADMTFEKKGVGCATCGEPTVAGVGSAPHHGSISWEMPLGLGADGRSVGLLSLYSIHLTPSLYTPASLSCALTGGQGEVKRDAGGSLRQVLVPQALADIVTTSAESYEVRLYDRAAVGPVGEDGLYPVSGSPYIVWRVDNPGGTSKWRMTRIVGNTSEATLVDESQPGLQIFSEANGARVTEATETTEGSDRVQTIVIKDAAGQISSKKKVYYRTFNLGEEKVKEILDPDGAALTTIWTYSTAANQTYQKLISLQHPSGFVESWQYSNETGDLQFHLYAGLHATLATGSSRGLTDLNADGVVDTLWSEGDSAYGEAGARFRIDWGGKLTISGVDYQARESKKVLSFSAAWNDPSNATTKERIYLGGPYDGRLAYQLNPDGTLELHRYATAADGSVTSTDEQGAADASREVVVDGTRTVRVTSPRGFLVSTVVTDIASGRQISSELVGQTDAFGRPTEIQHTDGSIETRNYCISCGAVDHIALRGESTDYEYDALKRRVREIRRAGSTVLSHTRFEYDADGRLLKTWRVDPADDTETLVSATTYDLAGRVVAQTSLATGTTTYGYEFLDANSIRTTTTYADGGTRIEYRDAGGQLYKLQGSTVAPIEYTWGAREWWGGGVGRFEYLRRYLDETNYVTETHDINYFGEVTNVTNPDGSRSYRYFDGIGRLARTVDEDSVTTLFGYDARGRQNVTAIDLDGSNTLDFAGSDRVTRTLSEYGVRDGSTVARTTTQVWETAGQDAPTSLSVAEQAVDGLKSWQTTRGLTSATVVTYDNAGGHTVTTTGPDGTVSVQTFLGNRLQTAVLSHSAIGTLSSTSNAYNSIGELIGATDARTGTTSYSYDANDRVHTITSPDPDPTRSGGGYDPQTTTYTYDLMGRVSSVTQPDGGVVTTTYWPNGQTKRVSGARTYPVEYTYDFLNRLKTLTTWQDFAGNAGQAVTTWNYDDTRGWLANKRYADNTGPSYTYKPSGRLQRRTWARGVYTAYYYNAAGDLTDLYYSDSTPHVGMSYDRAGRPATITDAAGSRTLAYDASGQLKDEDYSSGLLAGLGVHRTFDSLSRLSGVSALNSQPSTLNSVSYGYDAASRLATVTTGPNTATYAYLPNSPLVQSVTLAQGANTRLTTTKVYDNLNRLTSISSQPSALSSQLSYTYSYNSANQRTKATREDSAYWDYTYDALGQVTSGKKSTASGAILPAHDFAWTYDDIGNRKTSTVGGAPLPRESVYTANLLNQYSARTVPGAFDLLAAAEPSATVSYEYPADSGLPAALPRVGNFLYRQFTVDNATGGVDASVKVTGVKNNAGPSGEDVVTEVTRGLFIPQTPERYTYDADGNLTGDGQWSYAWDGENHLQKMERTALAPGGLLGSYYNHTTATIWTGPADLTRVEAVNFDWGTASPGSAIGVDHFNVLWTGQIEAPVTGDYLFESESDDGAEVWVNGVEIVANWGQREGNSVAQGTVSLVAGQKYDFKVYYLNVDGPAVMKLRWRKPGDSITTIIPAERLYHPAASLPLVKLEFAYDGQGRRVSKKVSNWDGGAWTLAGSTLFLYDGWNLIAELNAMNANAAIRTYTWGLDLSGSFQGAGGVGGLLLAQTLDPNTQTLKPHGAVFDGNGNVIASVDLATGAKSATYEYNAFGETIIADGVDLPFRFSTKYTDGESALLYYGLRYYSASTGRWLNRDPMEENGGANLYRFIENRTIDFIDPLGLEKVVPWLMIHYRKSEFTLSVSGTEKAADKGIEKLILRRSPWVRAAKLIKKLYEIYDKAETLMDLIGEEYYFEEIDITKCDCANLKEIETKYVLIGVEFERAVGGAKLEAGSKIVIKFKYVEEYLYSGCD